MASKNAFKNAPWKNSHEAYKSSNFNISPAPEYSNSETLLSSLYRVIGLPNVSDKNVPQNGRDLDKKLRKLLEKESSNGPVGSTISLDSWKSIISGVLESPKLPNQSSKRFIQTIPLVPQVAVFSGSARLTANSWVPGSLIRKMIWFGAGEFECGAKVWKNLFNSLTVNDDDDVFAQWLEAECLSWNADQPWQIQVPNVSEVPQISNEDFEKIEFFPARQFVKDLEALIAVKTFITRRQWTSMLEALLRLASVAHVLWLCDIQSRIWRCFIDAYRGKSDWGIDETRNCLFPETPEYMTYGGKALNTIKHKISSHLLARIGINSFMWFLSEHESSVEFKLNSAEDIANACKFIHKHRNGSMTQAWDLFSELSESESRTINGEKSGVGSSLFEFSRHVLGKRQTANQLLKGYDQSFILKKQGSYSQSPWVVSLGPVSILTFVHCCLFRSGGPRSIQLLGEHISSYGIAIDKYEISRNELGAQLRMLGLVLDSPDAESGLLLLPPFPQAF